MSLKKPVKTALNISQQVATITLCRPDCHNAFDELMIEELTQHFSAVERDPEVRVVLLTGEGKSFSAGADLAWMKKAAHYSKVENQKDAKLLATMLKTLYELKKPTIAVVNGTAFGGAIGLIACCDIVLAGETAQFCFPEVKLGLAPAVISPFVIAAIGPRAARRYFLTAELFSAKTAQTLGLVHEVVNNPEEKANQICHQLLQNGPKAIQAIKQLLKKPIEPALAKKTVELIAKLRTSPEGQEGLAAFLEKRKPSWTDV